MTLKEKWDAATALLRDAVPERLKPEFDRIAEASRDKFLTDTGDDRWQTHIFYAFDVPPFEDMFTEDEHDAYSKVFDLAMHIIDPDYPVEDDE